MRLEGYEVKLTEKKIKELKSKYSFSKHILERLGEYKRRKIIFGDDIVLEP